MDDLLVKTATLKSSRKPYKSPSSLNSLTNDILIPQALFQEPASSRSDPHGYPDILFHVVNFPEVGVKVSALNRTKVPRLSGKDS